MRDKEKIGVGIITCSRKPLFERLFSSLQDCKESIDHLCIVEDIINVDDECYVGDVVEGRWKGDNTMRRVITDKNMGVGVSKNHALRWLLKDGCNHIFLIEDDIYIKDPSVFQKYIEASKVSGIQHFNFSQHGIMNKVGFTNNGEPNPKLTIDYKSARISLFGHCVGAFSYYSAHCLKTVGLMDERYYNACEHVDHTYDIIKAGMHPPFWNFADIENSQDYLGDEPWTLRNSTISSRKDHPELITEADKLFLEKHQTLPTYIPNVKEEEEVYKSLKEIKSEYE